MPEKPLPTQDREGAAVNPATILHTQGEVVAVCRAFCPSDEWASSYAASPPSSCGALARAATRELPPPHSFFANHTYPTYFSPLCWKRPQLLPMHRAQKTPRLSGARWGRVMASSMRYAQKPAGRHVDDFCLSITNKSYVCLRKYAGINDAGDLRNCSATSRTSD